MNDKYFGMLLVLGEGNFGCVHKARANGIIPGDDVRNIVAVKTLKGQLIAHLMYSKDHLIVDDARPSDIDDLKQELHILKKIQPHCNIMNLLGYCSKPGLMILLNYKYIQ